MTDAPRPDLTAADWAAMRATIEHEERATTHWDGCWTTHRNCRTLLALDALARQQEANARLTAENARLKEDGADHKGAEIADVHAEILHRAEHAEAALADRDATIARLREFLTLQKSHYQAALDGGAASDTFLSRIRGKRDMCGEALAQLSLTPAKEADRG
jgi:hypothetical protein